MDLRICLECGHIWDSGDEWTNKNTCFICTVNKRPDHNIAELGQVILKLRRADLLHHGKLK